MFNVKMAKVKRAHEFEVRTLKRQTEIESVEFVRDATIQITKAVTREYKVLLR